MYTAASCPLPPFNHMGLVRKLTEPESLNFYGAQESIPRNQFPQPMKPSGSVSCRTGPLGYMCWGNRFLGIDFWAP